MKRALAVVLAALMVLTVGGSATADAAPTYGDFSMMFSKSYGQYYAGNQVGGQWAWDPQSATESQIMWGMPWPPSSPPTYRERFVLFGDWVTLPGWYDNGTYYEVTTTTEWQAAADCRTGRTYLPAGGPQHYVRWTVPSTAYCLYAEGVVTEQSTGNALRFVHQQVWSPPAACPVNAAPNAIRHPGEVFFTPGSCISQWESWSDDRGGSLALKLERSALLAKGAGMAYQIHQTYPNTWAADERYAGLWG